MTKSFQTPDDSTSVAKSRVECRPKPSAKAAAVCIPFFFLFLVAGGILTSPPSSAPHNPQHYPSATPAAYLVVAFVVIGFFIAPIVGVWLFLKSYVVADEEGLRWRIGFRTDVVRWDEISDFYVTAGPDAPERIVHGRGVLNIPTDFTNRHLLREAVALRATKAAHREWRLNPRIGFHRRYSLDEPRTFTYDGWAIRFLWLLMVGGVCMVPVLWYLAWNTASHWSNAAGGMSPVSWWFFALAVSGGAAFGLLGVVVCWPLIQARKGREREVLVLSRSGLTWTNGEQKIESSWQGVKGVEHHRAGHFSPGPLHCRIETETGTFELLPEVFSDFMEVKAFLVECLPSYVKIREPVNPEQLAVVEEDDGTLRFGFKTTNQRLNFCYAGGVILFGLVFLVLAPSGMLRRDGSSSNLSAYWFAIPALIAGFPYLSLAIAEYRAGWIKVTGDGLEQHLPWRHDFIPWPEIREYYRTKFDYRLILADGQVFRIPLTVGGYERLAERIQRRAVNASTKDWQMR